MTSGFKLGHLADIALVTLVLAFVCMGFVELYAAAGQTLASFGASAPFYDVYQSGQNPWAQAGAPEETPRLASSSHGGPRR